MAIEVERKYLVTDDSYRTLSYSCDYIVQGYLCRQNGNSVRIRIRDKRGYITIKGPSYNQGLSRYEWEKEIPIEEAQELLQLCGNAKIEKHRYLVKHSGRIFEVDEFHGDNEGLVVAEVELQDENEKTDKPGFLGKEVTGEARYYNSHLTHFPFKNW